MTMRFRTKTLIEAIQYRGEENIEDVIEFVGEGRLRFNGGRGTMLLRVSSATSGFGCVSKSVKYGDYIIRSGTKLDVMDKYDFRLKYEAM